jgi:hypothetical protein
MNWRKRMGSNPPPDAGLRIPPILRMIFTLKGGIMQGKTVKKQVLKKLVLEKETIQNLEAPSLKKALGGMYDSFDQQCPSCSC